MGKRPSDKTFAKAIPGSGGIISTIAKRTGVNWHTAKLAITQSETLTQLYEDERETVFDGCESVIIKSALAGDKQDAKWVLSRLAKGRVSADRHELTGKDGEPISFITTVDFGLDNDDDD